MRAGEAGQAGACAIEAEPMTRAIVDTLACMAVKAAPTCLAVALPIMASAMPRAQASVRACASCVARVACVTARAMAIAVEANALAVAIVDTAPLRAVGTHPTGVALAGTLQARAAAAARV